jgi:acetyl-CoA synthetase
MPQQANDQPAWTPSPQTIARANVTALAEQLGLPDYPALHRWSAEHFDQYWQIVIDRLPVRLRKRHDGICDLTHPTRPRWLVGGRLNIVDSCLQADPDAIAIVEPRARSLARISYRELGRRVAQIANGLVAHGIGPGDGVGIVMPMHGESVAAYLGAIACGATVISVADSFAAEEIAVRLRLGNAKLTLTQDAICRGEKRLPLAERVRAATSAPVLVAPVEDPAFFPHAAERFEPIERDPQDAINILFSSGTTGEPKAIPWDHTTPIKCAADAHFHQDIHPGDILCWPTSLGWMMGPWLIFASLMNRATMALYGQAPSDAEFGRFVRDAAVTMLGVVPSMVRSWRQSGAMDGIDWSRIRCFSSSGECSNSDEMRWLMQRGAGDGEAGKPVIEYCGGTEIGGAYLTGTVVQPNVAAAFSTPALGIGLILLDETGKIADRGEVFLTNPSIGLSSRLFKGDHEAVYFDGAPAIGGAFPLRRHGDELERLPDGFWRAIGRYDDTMNLGGIKVGCAEIERVLNTLPGIAETAAVAVAPSAGGPSRLVIFAVPGPGAAIDPAALKPPMQQAIRRHLNPLFHIDQVIILPALPRTATNKVMRRKLRASIS